jgi:predicted O-methyltransferase YrrM
MKICYVPADMDGPGFYRCLSPGRQLSEHGYDVFMPEREEKKVSTYRAYTDLNGDEILDEDGDPYTYEDARYRTTFKFDLDLPRSADLYVFQQWRERVIAESGIMKLRANGYAITMDVDDNYVNVDPANPSFLGSHPYRRADGTIVNRSQRRAVKRQTGYMPPPNRENRHHMLESMRQVDLVTVSTPFLAEAYAPYNRDIRVIRNYVDWDMWNDVTPQYEVERERLRIGYLASFRYHRADLQILQDVIPRFLKNHPEVDFVANSDEVHRYLRVPKEQRITIGEYEFFDHETGAYQVGRKTAVCDIGLVPLVLNDLNQGKSHLKGMEYNAAGIPFIASPTESYKDYWCNQFPTWKYPGGMIASSDSEWYSLLEEFAGNDDWRRKCGEWGRQQARRHCIQENWREWADVYEELAGGPHNATARKAIPIGAVQKVSELAPFLELVEEKRPKTIVEIGTARGGTFWAIAQHAPADALLVSIDIPAGSPMDMRNGKDVYTGRDRERIKTLIKGTQSLRLIDMNSQLPGALAALTHALQGRQIDLLFIDGDHRYEGVKSDYEIFSPLVAPGGMIAFHDIVTHEDERVGVDRFWREVKRKAKCWDEFVGPETWGFTPWGGIGVIFND